MTTPRLTSHYPTAAQAHEIACLSVGGGRPGGCAERSNKPLKSFGAAARYPAEAAPMKSTACMASYPTRNRDGIHQDQHPRLVRPL